MFIIDLAFVVAKILTVMFFIGCAGDLVELVANIFKEEVFSK